MEVDQPVQKLRAAPGDASRCNLNLVDYIPWTGAPYTLLKGYFSQMETHIWQAVKGPLTQLRNMLLATQIGSSGSAGKRAEKMTEKELVGWLYDPRLYVPDWWAQSHASDPSRSDGKRRRTDDDEGSDDRLGKSRKLDEFCQTRLGSGTIAANNVATNKEEKDSVVSVTPKPKDDLDTTDHDYYTQYLAGGRSNPLILPAKRYRLAPAVKQIIESCWMSVTEDLRKCQCGICARRDRQDRIKLEERQRQREEERMQRELNAQKLRQLEMMLQASQQAIPPMTAPDTGITTMDDPSPDSFDLLDELSQIENDSEMLSDDDSYDDDSDEEENTTLTRLAIQRNGWTQQPVDEQD